MQSVKSGLWTLPYTAFTKALVFKFGSMKNVPSHSLVMHVTTAITNRLCDQAWKIGHKFKNSILVY